MDEKTQASLLKINQDFYDAYAQSFSATRQKIQNGVSSLLESIPKTARVLDLGCGNGNFSSALVSYGFSGTYLGLDNSPTFISEAQAHLQPYRTQGTFSFQQADLSSPAWYQSLADQSFDVVTAFAVLHHMPGESLHRQLFAQVSKLLAPKGQFFLSAWQLLNSPRLHERILPWETLDIDSSQFSDKDVLMDWRAEAELSIPARRYVHLFDSAELQALGTEAGLRLQSEFYSDGKRSNLALYQIWEKSGD